MKKHYLRSRHKSALTVVEITITSSLVIILGILLLYVTSNWYFGSTIEAAEEADENIQIIRSVLMIEKIEYDDYAGKASLTIRNVAKDSLSLRIIAVDLVTMDNRIMGHKALSDRDYVLRRGERMVLENVPVCSADQCRRGDILRYRVWFVPERYIEEQASASVKAEFVESAFIYVGERHLACPPPSERHLDHVLIDDVDPVLAASGEFTSSNEITIRPALKSGPPSTTDFIVRVERLDGSASGEGYARNVRVPSPGDVRVVGKFNSIKVPFRITISSSDPNIMVVPREWIMDGKPGSAFVGGISFLWRETDYKVHMIKVEVGSDRLPKSTNVKVSIKLVDCLGNKLVEAEMSERILPGTFSYLHIFIELPEPISLDQIYYVETRIVESG